LLFQFLKLLPKHSRKPVTSCQSLRAAAPSLFVKLATQYSRPVWMTPEVPLQPLAEAEPVSARTAQKTQRVEVVSNARPAPGWPYHDASEQFRAWNESRAAQGAELRTAIGRIDEKLQATAAPGQLPLARDIRQQIDPVELGRTKLPGLRAIQIQLRRSRIERLGIRATTQWAKRVTGRPQRRTRTNRKKTRSEDNNL
jgi:hypothetical protein